ncbi:MAG: hypothetical protein ABJQ29_05005 [Luteolibacter sp.]
MKSPRPFLLSALCLAPLISHAAENVDLTLPPGIKAISSPLDLGDSAPGSLAFAEKGGVLLFPAHGKDYTESTQIPRIKNADGELAQTLESPTTTSGAFSYGGALYLGGSPAFYIVDENGEFRAFAEGFGINAERHKNAPVVFALGLDGRIYGTFGDSGLSVTGTDGSKSKCPQSGAVFRFEPDGTGFEIVHRGLINPSGIAFNEFGDAIAVDAAAGIGDKARVIRILEDGDSGWSTDYLKTDPTTSRWMTEKMWQTRNDVQPAYVLPAAAHLTTNPSGLSYYPGTGFLETEERRFLVGDNTGDVATSGILSFGIREKRGGIELVKPQLLVSGIESSGMAYTTDGALVLADTRDKGTLLLLDPGEKIHLSEENAEAATLLSEGFDQRSSEALGDLLGHANSRVRLSAQIALTRKKDAVEVFKKALESTQLLTRIHAIHGLGIIARRGSSPAPDGKFAALPAKGLRDSAAALLVSLLADPNPEIRVQVLRAIGDAPVSGDALPIGSLLYDDSDRVRHAAAIAIGKLQALGQYSAIVNFLAKNNNRDPYLSHAGSFALQHMTRDARQISALTAYDSAAVRLAAVVALRRMKNIEVVRFLNDTDPAVQDEVIRTVIDANMSDAFPMLAELLEGKSREWPPAILALLEEAKAALP